MYGENNMGRSRKDYKGFRKEGSYLEALEFSHIENKPYGNIQYYKTKCHKCGNVVILNTSALRSQKSCGCLLKEYRKNILGKLITKHNQLPSGKAQFNRLISDYKNRAKRKNLPFELTDNDFSDLIKQNCVYCGSEPSLSINERKGFKNRNILGDLIYNGIDRIDSLKGYTKNNVVPCCHICNKAKRDLELDEFLSWINKIKKYESKFKLGNT